MDLDIAQNTDGTYSITGRALPGLELTVGDQVIVADANGRFSTTLPSLPDGGLAVRIGDGPATLFGASLAPSLESLSPTQGSQGDTVTITGVNFSVVPSANNVKFNGAPGQVISATETELKVIVPNAASAGPITVTVAGKTSNALHFDFVSLGLPNGSFETGDLNGFTVSGTVAVITSLGAHNPTHGRFQVWLNTLHDPALGESVLTTDRFVVPEGLEYLIFDYQFLGTKVFNPVREYLELRLIKEGSETLAEGVFPERPPTITENRMSGYAVGNGLQSAMVDMRTYAGQERPIQVTFRLKGIGVIPADKAGSDGGSSLRGTGMLVDNLRLSGSGSLPAAVDQSQVVIGPAVSGGVTITGLAGAVVPGSQVYLQTGQTGDRREVAVAADGSFTLTAAVYDQAHTFYSLFYSTPRTTTDNTSNRLFSPSLILRLPAE